MVLGRISLLCALVAAVAADCGHLQIIKVKSQWADAYGVGSQRTAFSQALWRAIFSNAPEARDLFNRVNGDDVTSPEFKAHALRVVDGLDMTISLMDDEQAFEAQLAHLQGQHIDRKIPGNYFQVFGEALLQVVPAAIGKCFDRDAWVSCYERISNGIKA